MTRTTRFCIIAAAAAFVSMPFLLPFARAQVQMGLVYVPIGVAASGGSSTAWFHLPSSGTVVACQPSGSGGAATGIQCVAGKLP